MRIIVRPTAFEAAEFGAAIIADLVQRMPAAVLGVATGSSPQPLYAALGSYAAAGLDFSAVTAFALDEYVGIDRAHPQSYHSVLHREVVRRLGLNPAAMNVPDGRADPVIAGAAYEAAIAAAGGIDLQILGIGSNGHLGFNEPGSSFASRTREVTLTARTRADNRRFFGGDLNAVPLSAITQGIGTILEARTLLLVANGSAKAAAIAAAIDGPLSPSCPASAVQLHPNVTLLLDEASAALLAPGGAVH
ncbi:MAG: glucosamine-6-phosphate deaminase [Microcella sp.]|nr:glucosamine-6-phosphate deaminase [Microcella sp.]